jgi:hypothetical protein
MSVATFLLCYIQLLTGWSVQKTSVQCMLLNPNGQKNS